MHDLQLAGALLKGCYLLLPQEASTYAIYVIAKRVWRSVTYLSFPLYLHEVVVWRRLCNKIALSSLVVFYVIYFKFLVYNNVNLLLTILVLAL